MCSRSLIFQASTPIIRCNWRAKLELVVGQFHFGNVALRRFMAPWLGPLRTACWNCCRLRFSDSVADENATPVEDNLTSPRVIADNILLAVRYSGIAAYGCVVVESSGVSSVHSVVPVPWCEVCNFVAAPTESCLVNPIPSVYVPEELRILSDNRGGVVRRILLLINDGTETPKIPFCSSAFIAPHPHEKERRTAFRGEGKGATRDDATRSAIGEGIERYALDLAPFDANLRFI